MSQNENETKIVEETKGGLKILRIRSFLFPVNHDEKLVAIITMFNRNKNLGKTYIEVTDPKTWFKREEIRESKLLASEEEAFNIHNLFCEKMYKEVRPHVQNVSTNTETQRV